MSHKRWPVMKSAIRKARPTDAATACLALRRSIQECCAEDHRGDPAILEGWLRNKTEETLRGWFEWPTKFAVVAEREGLIVGVGMLDLGGAIELCYLVPEARFLGLGRRMLDALEDEARSQGISTLELVSTRTAHAFYRRNGYVDTGETVDCFGLCAPRMRKAIVERT